MSKVIWLGIVAFKVAGNVEVFAFGGIFEKRPADLQMLN
jgi:hypothetical protein